jgi:hypothetical protein
MFQLGLAILIYLYQESRSEISDQSSDITRKTMDTFFLKIIEFQEQTL